MACNDSWIKKWRINYRKNSVLIEECLNESELMLPLALNSTFQLINFRLGQASGMQWLQWLQWLYWLVAAALHPLHQSALSWLSCHSAGVPSPLLSNVIPHTPTPLDRTKVEKTVKNTIHILVTQFRLLSYIIENKKKIKKRAWGSSLRTYLP